jgi:hypothetical protein
MSIFDTTQDVDDGVHSPATSQNELAEQAVPINRNAQPGVDSDYLASILLTEAATERQNRCFH